MNLHEYQAKQLFAAHGLPVTLGLTGTSVDEVIHACQTLGGSQWVIKAQVHAGGRGKAGGVRKVDSLDEAAEFARRWLGERLVSFQTDSHGQPVNRLLVEPCIDFERELYLSVLVDRSSQRLVCLASAAGGMDIEDVARSMPERIFRETIDPLTGPQPFQGRALAYRLGLVGGQARQFSDIFVKACRLFAVCDLSLLEINPLVVRSDGSLHCLDAKMAVDGNALYCHPDLRALRDVTQEDPREAQADKFELNYVALDGNIGCLVNGAGLAMGTMDMVSLHGGRPANFLDVGGGTTTGRVSEAFKIILADDKVRAVLVNIFGGIVRCDMIAEGIISAVREVGVKVPVVVRLEGNHATEGARLLADSGLNTMAARSLDEAARLAVAAAEGRA